MRLRLNIKTVPTKDKESQCFLHSFSPSRKRGSMSAPSVASPLRHVRVCTRVCTSGRARARAHTPVTAQGGVAGGTGETRRLAQTRSRSRRCRESPASVPRRAGFTYRRPSCLQRSTAVSEDLWPRVAGTRLSPPCSSDQLRGRPCTPGWDRWPWARRGGHRGTGEWHAPFAVGQLRLTPSVVPCVGGVPPADAEPQCV